MGRKGMMKLLIILAIVGNVAYFLWILVNGIDEGFRGTLVQYVSFTGMLVLLILNTVLLSLK